MKKIILLLSQGPGLYPFCFSRIVDFFYWFLFSYSLWFCIIFPTVSYILSSSGTPNIVVPNFYPFFLELYQCRSCKWQMFYFLDRLRETIRLLWPWVQWPLKAVWRKGIHLKMTQIEITWTLTWVTLQHVFSLPF